jgi:uncharacterized protein
MPYGLNIQLFEQLLTFLEKNPVIESATLFGSRAKGNFKPGSDVDIAIKGKGLSLKDVFLIQNQLDDLDQQYLFDIIIYENISEPALVEHIDRAGIEIYKKI